MNAPDGTGGACTEKTHRAGLGVGWRVASGLIGRCAATGPCPRVMWANGNTETECSVKRIHFTGQDLMRIRVAGTIGAAAETLDSVKLLHAPEVGLGFRRWHVPSSRCCRPWGPMST